jgi:hypothetical protein
MYVIFHINIMEFAHKQNEKKRGNFGLLVFNHVASFDDECAALNVLIRHYKG